MRITCIGLLLALGLACLPARAGDQIRLGAIVFTPGFPYGAVSYGRHPVGDGFYGHRYYPRAFRHYPRSYGRHYGRDHYDSYRHGLHRYARHHGHRYHPRRDLRRNYRHFGAPGYFFPRGTVIRYVRHHHNAWCGH